MSRAGTDVLERAPKPSPVDSMFDGCGPAGSQPDYALNRRKNRVDSGDYVAIAWNTLGRLPWPRTVGYRFRNQWTPGEAQEVARYEGAAVQVEGYFAGYKLELREPPNCYSDEPTHRDYHLWLSRDPHGALKHSIVVEITPRIRARHPRWTDSALAALVSRQTRVRVRGWLMLDQMHPELVGWNRTTLWEVHPLMELDWQTPTGQWLPVDSVPIAQSLRAVGGVHLVGLVTAAQSVRLGRVANDAGVHIDTRQ